MLGDARAAAGRAATRWGNLAKAITAKGLHGGVGAISVSEAVLHFIVSSGICL